VALAGLGFRVRFRVRVRVAPSPPPVALTLLNQPRKTDPCFLLRRYFIYAGKGGIGEQRAPRSIFEDLTYASP